MSATKRSTRPAGRALIRPYGLFYLYARRLRVHTAQELFAGLGVAIAVALVFATLVASGSIAGSAAEVVHKIIGPASLQLRARGPEGFEERLLSRVEALPGVKQAAPLLEATGTITAPSGRHETVYLAGTDISLATLNGLAHTLPIATLAPGGIGLTRASAAAVGISSASTSAGGAQQVRLDLRGHVFSLKVAAVVGAEEAGVLSRAQVAVLSLEHLQRLMELKGRISRILVQAEPGRLAAVRAELQALAGGTLTVAPADQDVSLLRQALQPSDQASTGFAAVAALLGLLFAFNALLLTVPERRHEIADMRLDGATNAAIVQMVLFEALCLGIIASLVGLGIGYLLAAHVFHQSPGYLSQAFLLGGGTVISLAPALLSLAGGILATGLASSVPLFDLRRNRAIDEVYFEAGQPGGALAHGAGLRLAIAAASLVALATAVLLLKPSAVVLAVASLALGTALAAPVVLTGALRIGEPLAERSQGLTILTVAITWLRETELRSIALAATGAVALFGGVALGGATDDLLRGLEDFGNVYAHEAQVWVLNQGDPLGTNEITAGRQVALIAGLPGVAHVDQLQSSFVDIGGRRVWVIAQPADAGAQILASQIVDGSPSLAGTRLDEGGWVTISQQIAATDHLGIGSTLHILTPTGQASFRVAATTTNLGWTAGAMLMNTSDYRRAWDTSSPTALGVHLRPDASPEKAQRTVAAALGPNSGLEVLTASERSRRFDAIAQDGLNQLEWISTMLVIAAIIALAAALTSTIWARRVTLSEMRLEAAPRRRLQRILLMESALMLGSGCVTGLIAGIYGQVVLDAYLAHVTGFPVASISAGWRPLEILALVGAIVLGIAAVPAWLAARVSPELSLEGE